MWNKELTLNERIWITYAIKTLYQTKKYLNKEDKEYLNKLYKKIACEE